jgi:hypothetical protein
MSPIMKRSLNPMKFLAALALLAFVVGCATMQKEQLLSEAGFKTVTASTPKQQQRLKNADAGQNYFREEAQWENLLRLPGPRSQPILCWRPGSISEIPTTSFAAETERREDRCRDGRTRG